MAFTAQVITTAQWNAKPPLHAFHLRTPKYVIVHHTADQNPPNDPSHGDRNGAIALAQRIQRDHFARGWSDSGHNFLNTTGGIVLEGRTGTVAALQQGRCVQSAHAAQDAGRLANGNDSPGIENEGNFMTFVMGQAQWDSLVALCAALCDACNVSTDNIRGHREFSSTQCPGDWLFSQLPRLRQEVAAKLGRPATPAPAAAAPAVPASFRFGDAGPLVMTIQMLLAGKGHSAGAIDGIFGENTRAAVVAFQKDAGIVPADGVVDPKTRQALGL